MQTAANEPTVAPQRDIDTIILEARHLLGTSEPTTVKRAVRYPTDPVTIAKVLTLREESGLSRERFCDRVRVTPATMYCWEQGQTSGGKPWPALALLLAQRKAAAASALLSTEVKNPLDAPSPGPRPMWSIDPQSKAKELTEQAAKRLEGLKLAPPVVGVAADTANDLLHGRIGPTSGRLLHSAPVTAPQTIARGSVEPTNAQRVTAETHFDFAGIETRVLAHHVVGDRIKGAEVTKARDEAYAAYQAATDRMPTAEAAANLVVAYRRSHRGLENFCRGHYDAAKMYARLAMWTAGRDETGEQWDRLIGLLQMRGIKPSTEGLTKRAKRDGEHTSDLARRVKGWTDLAGRFHASEAEAVTASWNIKVERATDEVLRRAKAARVTVRSYLISHEAEKPVADLSRALKGREAYGNAMKEQK